VFEDRSLVRRFNAGDAQALRRIYEKYRADLFRVAGALLGNSSAVVNVGPAIRIITTGQQIRVDGNRGTVTILE